ncbi:uncharacterized protein BX663DRAFT_322147 [Cokeromyces recurvatus]|uniref:uncharacterized protein n=1 Tax=Cokeromyces recurvatus TaxID=90255 RepID=UPI002221209C|nr:uncharacterized protein BX663DRAFT_322147 [Cokeromyces recurvatus]KAI7904596.1 hypothetical protein BX663DRAFT_322147 [Cokeromyces recurvatus]
MMPQPIPVFIEYHCHVCNERLSTAPVLIKHLEKFHSIQIERRKPGKNRPKDVKYEFKKKKEANTNYVIHFGCPTCWFHCEPNYQTIAEHIKNEHVDNQVTNKPTIIDAPEPIMYQHRYYDNNHYDEFNPAHDYHDNYRDMKDHHQINMEAHHQINMDKQDNNHLDSSAKQKELLGLVDDLVANFKRLFTDKVMTK